MKTQRKSIYTAIDHERQYQEKKWGSIEDHPHEVGGYLLIMQSELQEAIQSWVKSHDDIDALREILQVAAVAVACLEQHGVSERIVADLHWTDFPAPP